MAWPPVLVPNPTDQTHALQAALGNGISSFTVGGTSVGLTEAASAPAKPRPDGCLYASHRNALFAVRPQWGGGLMTLAGPQIARSSQRCETSDTRHGGLQSTNYPAGG